MITPIAETPPALAGGQTDLSGTCHHRIAVRTQANAPSSRYLTRMSAKVNVYDMNSLNHTNLLTKPNLVTVREHVMIT